MASIHITLPGNTPFGGKASSLVSSSRAVVNQALEVLAISNAYLGASPNLALDATYADLAIALGMTGATANADAHTFYTLLAGAQGRLTGPIITAFIDQLG